MILKISRRFLPSFAATLLSLFTLAAGGQAVTPLTELDMSFDGGSGPTFWNGSPGYISTVAIQTDGKILIGGSFDGINGITQDGIARLDTNGNVDNTFAASLNPAARQLVNTIVLQTDGKILLGGNFMPPDQVSVARLHSDGTLDSSFHPLRLAGVVQTLLATTGSRIIVGGSLAADRGSPPYGVFRLQSDGSVDTSFAGSVHSFSRNSGYILSPGSVGFLALQDNGSLLAGGNFVSVNSKSDPGYRASGFVRFDEAGRPDAAFRPTGFEPADVGCSLPCQSLPQQKAFLTALAVQSDGKILIGRQGGFVTGSAPLASFLRLNANGSVDSTFSSIVLDSRNAGSDRPRIVNAVTAQHDGKIIIGGAFIDVRGVPRAGLARLNADGALDDWMANQGITGGSGIRAIAIQRDGRIIIGGSFTNVAGVRRAGIARIFPSLPGVRLVNPNWRAGVFSVSVSTSSNLIYTLQSKDSLSDTTWTTRASVAGDGTVKTLEDGARGSKRFYRLVEQRNP